MRLQIEVEVISPTQNLQPEGVTLNGLPAVQKTEMLKRS